VGSKIIEHTIESAGLGVLFSGFQQNCNLIIMILYLSWWLYLDWY